MPRKSNTRAPQGVGSIRKRKDGTYEGRYTIGRDPGTGRQVQKSVYAKTEAEVVKKLRSLANQASDGSYTPPSKMKLSQWLDIWLEEYLTSVKPLTKIKYETLVRVHIKPKLGAVKLTALSAPMIQKLYNDELRSGAAVKSVKCLHGGLHKALSQAVKLGYLPFNPADACDLPKLVHKEAPHMEDDSVQRFLQAVKGHKYERLYLTTLFTGMRQGEVLGLTWDNVDFSSNTLTIARQLQKIDKQYQLVPLKTNKSRTIAAAPFVMDLLRLQQRNQKEMRLRIGSAWQNPMNLVFTNEMGGCLVAGTVYKNFKALAEMIQMDALRFHDLRHTFATLSLQNGDDTKTVQNNLGHSTPSTTLAIYAHVTERMKTQSASRMQAYIEAVQE